MCLMIYKAFRLNTALQVIEFIDPNITMVDGI